MKRVLSLVLAFVMLLSFMTVAMAAEDVIKVVLGGEEIDFADVPPQIINDRTMVPLRAIFEALGAEVLWDDATKTVTAVKGEVTIKMTIGKDSFMKNDEAVALDSPATIVEARTLVPVRAIAESFGSKVKWISETKTVEITEEKTVYNLLAFGNSYSQDAFTLLPEVAKAAGVDIYAVNMYTGGCPLKKHVEYMKGNGAYKKRVEYKPDGTSVSTDDVSFIDGLNTPGYAWDYISLQSRSVECYDFNNFEPYVKELADFVREKSPESEVILHQTWALSTDASTTKDQTKDLVSGMQKKEIRPFLFKTLKTNYMKASELIGNRGRMVPVGEAINYAIERLRFPEEYMYRDTTCHLTLDYGRTLAALCWYEYITGRDARENPYTNENISAKDMADLKSVAHYACSLEEYKK